MPDIRTVSRRQAWQFAMVPLETKGNDLHLLSTVEFAPRAARFVRRVLRMHPCVQLVSEMFLLDRLNQEFGFEGSMPQGFRPGYARWPTMSKTESGNSRI